MNSKTVRAHVIVRGRVQGVWFRESTRRRAIEVGVAGWVRNCTDGSVEAEFIGSPDAVASALRFVEHGPEFARVDSVETNPLEDVDTDVLVGSGQFLVR